MMLICILLKFIPLLTFQLKSIASVYYTLARRHSILLCRFAYSPVGYSVTKSTGSEILVALHGLTTSVCLCLIQNVNINSIAVNTANGQSILFFDLSSTEHNNLSVTLYIYRL